MSDRYCHTGKVVYDSERQAKQQIPSLKKNWPKHQYTVYHCEECEGYHISTTTKNLRKKKYMMKNFKIKVFKKSK